MIQFRLGLLKLLEPIARCGDLVLGLGDLLRQLLALLAEAIDFAGLVGLLGLGRSQIVRQL